MYTDNNNLSFKHKLSGTICDITRLSSVIKKIIPVDKFHCAIEYEWNVALSRNKNKSLPRIEIAWIVCSWYHRSSE